MGTSISVAGSEKADVRQVELGFRVVPDTAPHRMKVGGNLRPISVTHIVKESIQIRQKIHYSPHKLENRLIGWPGKQV